MQDDVVVDGEIARRLVGHVHVVPVVDQTDEGAAHRNHVVVGVRREDQHLFGKGLRRNGPRRVVGEFQNRLPHHAAQPDDRLARELGRPLAGADQPRRNLARELSGGVLVDHHLDVVVLLQRRGGHLIGDLPLDDLADHVGLLLAPCHEHDLVGAHDGIDPHRNGHFGRIVDPREGRRLDLAGIVRKLHQPRARLLVGAGLVEPELPLLADADNHQIDVVDRPVVGFAVTRDARFRHRPVGNMDVFGQDIDMVEKLLVDAVVAALRLVGPDRVEFVEAVNRDVRKTHHAVPVAAHQLVVKPQRRSAGRESQHEGLHVLENLVRKRIFVVFLDRPHDQIGDIPHAFGFVFEDRGGNLFIAADDVARSRVDDQSSVFGQSVFAVHIRIF